MKKFERILLYFGFLVRAMENNPPTLYDSSLQNIRNNLTMDMIRIISRINSDRSDKDSKLQYSGFKYVLNPSLKIPSKKIDLSGINLERIPISLAKQMTDIKELDLSNNLQLELSDEWFCYFYENLKELTLFNCIITDKSLEIIGKMKSLERLSFSSNTEVSINIKILEPVLKNIEYLDVSKCNFSLSDLKFILDCAKKLKTFKLNAVMQAQ